MDISSFSFITSASDGENRYCDQSLAYYYCYCKVSFIHIEKNPNPLILITNIFYMDGIKKALDLDNLIALICLLFLCSAQKQYSFITFILIFNILYVIHSIYNLAIQSASQNPRLEKSANITCQKSIHKLVSGVLVHAYLLYGSNQPCSKDVKSLAVVRSMVYELKS